jgi:hypothetical protein
MSGTVNVNGAKLLAGAIQGGAATLYASSGTLSLRDPVSDALVQNLYVSGTLTGPGDIHVCGIMTWQAGTMTGTGTTEICPGDTGQINPPGDSCVTLEDRHIVNRGTLTWDQGCIGVGPGGLIDNEGRFCLDSDSRTGMTLSTSQPESLPLFNNTGEICNTTPGRTTVTLPTINTGRIDDPQRNIMFSGKDGDDLTDRVWEGPENTPEGRILPTMRPKSAKTRTRPSTCSLSTR